MVAHEGMDLSIDMGGMGGMGMGGNSSDPLYISTQGYNPNNATDQANLIAALLVDDVTQLIGNAYAKRFWYGVSTVIGLATLFNFLRWLTLRMRLREAARGRKDPAKPRSLLARWFATITATAREVTYPQVSPTKRILWFKVPPLGTILMLLSYLAFVLALEYINNNIPGAKHWQALSVRAAWLAVAQMPLIILMINKNNLVGLLTGVSYERLNVFHRWSARMMLLLVTMHFGYESYGWHKFNLTALEWATDTCPPTGIAAYAFLLWLNLTTLAPFRYWSYEFFVVQHIITFFGLIIAIFIHLPSTAYGSRKWIYVPIGIYLLDRIIRTLLFAWTNFRRSRATLVQMPGPVTKIRLSNAAIKKWRVGSHVLISVPKFGIMQSHPATILSTPHSHNGDLVFCLKSHKGFTHRIMLGANSSETTLLPQSKEESTSGQTPAVVFDTHLALLDGPYGGSQSDFAAFDSVLLVAGSTGMTFTMSLLNDLADRANLSGKRLPVRRVHFLWCVKDSSWTSWVSEEISAAYQKLHAAGIEIEVSIHVTCAEQVTEAGNDLKDCACACDKSQGPCCCVLVDEDDEGKDADAISPATDNNHGVMTVDNEKKSAVANETALKNSSSGSSSPSTSFSPVRPLARRKEGGRTMPILPCATFYSGRPDIRAVVTDILDGAEGESAVAVCGPIGLSEETRNAVAGLSDERAVHKGTGAQGVYLHVEAFS